MNKGECGMTDLKKVIKNAQESLEILEKVDEPTFWLDFVKLSLFDVISLLKAQEPKTFIKEVKRRGDLKYYCEECSNEIVPGDNFCKICGQAVKWQ